MEKVDHVSYPGGTPWGSLRHKKTRGLINTNQTYHSIIMCNEHKYKKICSNKIMINCSENISKEKAMMGGRKLL